MKNAKIKEFLGWIKSTVITCIITIAVIKYIMSPAVVSGASMMPTYEDGDVVLLDIIGKKISGIERFDVILFEAPNGDTYIKRVIGLPGDHIAYENDTLYINDEANEEAYLDVYKKQLLNNSLLTGVPSEKCGFTTLRKNGHKIRACTTLTVGLLSF